MQKGFVVIQLLLNCNKFVNSDLVHFFTKNSGRFELRLGIYERHRIWTLIQSLRECVLREDNKSSVLNKSYLQHKRKF